MKKRLDAYRIFLIFQGGSAFFYRLVFTVNMFFYVDKVELNALQLILVGTALEGAVFLCEIPTGIVADVYSRRLSVIIGTLITGIGFLLSAIPVFGIILIGQATWGVGYTFISGAIQAWITDEIGEEAANRAFLRVAQIDQGFTIVGL
ncbi:MAG TPA: hypothetical protein VJZ27_06960, partial [Aggregatilineales bacterium]|nr:hypothetical protein [Aggregatilineales bacterium]